MKSINQVICITFLCIFYSSCRTELPKKNVGQHGGQGSLKDTVAFTAIDKTLDSLYQIGVFNGFSATVVDSSAVLYNRGFGFADVTAQKPYTPHTIINIASVSKMFIGVALLKAVDMNLVALDDPINNYLPFKVEHPYYPERPITVKQLATHTSGIVDTDIYLETCYVNTNDVPLVNGLERYASYYKNPAKDWIPLVSYMQQVLDVNGVYYQQETFAKRPPGSQYEYSNIGAALCGLIVEQASGQLFHEFTKQYIFQPLGMEATSWLFEDVDMNLYSKLYYDDLEVPYYTILSYPDGGLITSSTDLAKFLMELIKGYSGKGNMLSHNGFAELFRSQLPDSAFTNKKDFNVGIFTEKELPYHVIGHNGGDPGVNSMLYFNTETKQGQIFITNTDSKKENSKAVFWAIWSALEK